MGQGSSTRCSSRICVCTPGEESVQAGLLSRDLHEETDPVLAVGLEQPNSIDDAHLSVLQFSTDIYYCSEEDGSVQVSVMRFGDTSERASCKYTTLDGSAKQSQRYKSKSGTIKFEPGQTIKSIPIEIIQDDRYESTLEFHVKITETTNAQRGKYLYNCQVQVIDDDTFPTNKNRSFLKTVTTVDDLKDRISGYSLMAEYVRLNFSNKTLRRKTMWWLLYDSSRGFYFLLTLWLNMYLVDDVILGARRDEEESVVSRAEGRFLLQVIHAGARILSSSSSSDSGTDLAMGDEDLRRGEATQYRQHQALVIAFLYVVPFLLILFLELQKVKLAIPGVCRKALMGSLFRKFLHFRDDTRVRVSSGEISMSMTRDIPQVVESGYMKILEVTRKLTKMPMVFAFVLKENKMAIFPLLVFPLFQLFFLKVREANAIKVDREMDEQQDRMVQAVNNATDNIRTVVGFHLRPQIVTNLEGHIDRYNKCCGKCARTFVRHAHMAPTLTVIFVGGWMVFGTFQLDVFGGWLSLGTFLATITVFKEVGAEMQDIYFDLMEIQSACGPLRKITTFMNMSTDLEQRMELAKHRHSWGQMELEKALSEIGHQDHMAWKTAKLSCDLVKISLSDATFAYGGLTVLVAECDEEEGIDYGMLNGKYVSFGALNGNLLYKFDGPSPAGIKFDKADRRWKLYRDRYNDLIYSFASEPVAESTGSSSSGRPPGGRWTSPLDPNEWIDVKVATSETRGGRCTVDYQPRASMWLPQFESFSPLIVDKVTISFEQGRLHAIVGDKHEGKATLLKLLGQVIVPQEGFVGLPLHLRVLHVDRQAEILDCSLFRNLVIHDSTELSDESIDRIQQICEKCRFSRDMLRVIKDQADEYRKACKEAETPRMMTKRTTTTVADKPMTKEMTAGDKDRGWWSGRLTQTDCARLSIARALVYNPELLVMHTPLLVFDDQEAQRLLGLFVEHIESRGIGCSDDDRNLRRPRTVFFSSSSAKRATGAHHIYKLSSGNLFEVTETETPRSQDPERTTPYTGFG